MSAWNLHLGDCLDVLKTLPDASVDAVVTDPPYELGFMGKRWDASGIAYNVSLWTEALRALKPGGHLLAFGGTRTYHRMACAIEDAGFEVRDSLHWIYGSGFPKSLDVSKAIDATLLTGSSHSRDIKRINALRPGETRETATLPNNGVMNGDRRGGSTNDNPATDAARQWDGWGTALKPAHEPVVVARKPLVGTVAANVQMHGTGALNIDGCRVASYDGHLTARKPAIVESTPAGFGIGKPMGGSGSDLGRWPPNILLSHTPACGETCAEDCAVAEMDRQSGPAGSNSRTSAKSDGTRAGKRGDLFTWKNGNAIGKESKPDTRAAGGASRFFPRFRYQAKASRSERDEGLGALPRKTPAELTGRKEGSAGLIMADGKANPYAGTTGGESRANVHPTVKPVELMRWLVRLVTPPNGVVLDPFTGSGTTGVAAMLEGARFIGIEREAEYHAIATARIQHATASRDRVAQSRAAPANGDLFADLA